MNSRPHVLITGATGGIGAAIARRLAGMKCDLTLIARDPERLAVLADELRHEEITVTEIAMSLGTQSDYPELLQRVSNSNRPIDILINNAAINWFGHFADMPDEDIDGLIATNVTVPIRMARAALVGMRRSGRGIIVNIGSVFGSIGFAGFPVYSACKFALRGFSEALRRELSGTGVKVVYIAPRYTKTAFNDGAVDRMARATGMTMDAPDAVARRIVEAIVNQRPETLIGWPERAFAKLNAIIPRLVDRGLSRTNRKILAHAPEIATRHLLEEERS
ncbi:MAG: SDR family oxidoreductase [Rhodospirillaceae bacterium]|nr:SDR family oxidoreductase [Rhodospirillaceae bacterium]